jgi:hypothetical protein
MGSSPIGGVGNPPTPPPGHVGPQPVQPPQPAAEKPTREISEDEADELLKRLRRGEYIGKAAE